MNAPLRLAVLSREEQIKCVKEINKGRTKERGYIEYIQFVEERMEERMSVKEKSKAEGR